MGYFLSILILLLYIIYFFVNFVKLYLLTMFLCLYFLGALSVYYFNLHIYSKSIIHPIDDI